MKAFAPGSVTALFAPTESGDESMGASFAIEDGIVAEVRPADYGDVSTATDSVARGATESVVTVDGDPTDFEPVGLALDALSVTARVELTAEIPIGCGFGASGAATLATALAANAAFDLGKTREELLGISHRAEVTAGTGLGDVFVQEMGGLVVGNGTDRRRYDCETPVEYVSFGGISTEQMLADADLMARIERAGRRALDALSAEPTLAAVTREGWKFTEEVELATEEVREAVASAEDAGGVASMAMVGETVFAAGTEGALANRTRICPEGAGLL
ncbi:GHMP family kinase ATP-binding protein [Halorussus amylolyticus]|uniref:GHMP family kinase ATP-binding protein n=1 Tax=Halorussus amylolyticus TaxID=1126242 RepID=UPI00104BA9F0|nr:GHMP kinase [Halorussus amylolyticus]